MKPRPFGVVDAMLVIAAIAVGLWANRMDWAFAVASWRRPILADQLCAPAFVGVGLALPHLAAFTAVWLAMRVRPPRLPWRRISRRPGSLACLTACAAMIVILGAFAAVLARGHLVSLDIATQGWRTGGSGRDVLTWIRRPSGMALIPWADRVGIAVAGAWLALWASGRWHPESSWIDRSGRALGWAWIAVAAIVWALPLHRMVMPATPLPQSSPNPVSRGGRQLELAGLGTITNRRGHVPSQPPRRRYRRRRHPRGGRMAGGCWVKLRFV
jgi:hypothetical protein